MSIVKVGVITIGNLFGGAILASCGGWLLYTACFGKMLPSMRVRWLPKNLEGRDSIDRLMIGIVGFGFLLGGLLLIISGIQRVGE
jgi:hypothetical protein